MTLKSAALTGVVEVWAGVLDLHAEEARELILRSPALEELVVLLLLDLVVAGQLEALGVVRLQVGVRRLRPEAVKVGGEVA